MSRTSPLHFGIVVDSTVNSKFKLNPATTTGLTFGYLGATFQSNGNEITVAAGAVALTDNATNIVELNGSSVQAVTSGNESAVPLYKVVTLAGAITSVTDLRSTLQQ